jgi:exportin-7
MNVFLLLFQFFAKLRENIINSQPADKQPAMAQCFANLMDGIDRTLLTKNRDRLVS